MKQGQRSTDSFDGKKFQHHGKIIQYVNDSDIIVYRAEGPFNSEILAALDYIENVTLNEFKINIKRWSTIVIFEKSCMALDDLIIGFGEYLKQIKDNGLHSVSTAYVITPEIEGRSLMVKKYQKCFDDAGILFSIFDNEKDALLWAKSHLNNT